MVDARVAGKAGGASQHQDHAQTPEAIDYRHDRLLADLATAEAGDQGATGMTLTLTDACRCPSCVITVTSTPTPAAFAVTTPRASTVTTPGSVDSHVMAVSVAFAGKTAPTS